MQELGRQIGAACQGGAVLELVGDIGAGKTTLTKGIAQGMGIEEDVQSPTFTLSRTYELPGGGILAHYDFYRLSDPGILSAEIEDVTHAKDAVVVIEWADTVAHVLPADRIIVTIVPSGDESRVVRLVGGGEISHKILEAL